MWKARTELITWWSLWGLGFVFWTSQRKLGSRDLKAGNKNIKDGVSRVSCCRQQHSAASAPCSIYSFKANQTDQKKEKEARVGRKYLKINLFGSLFLRYDRSIYWSMLTELTGSTINWKKFYFDRSSSIIVEHSTRSHRTQGD